jgi:aryl-phospho-beta-D-glucosidase BglC (GH1 family)
MNRKYLIVSLCFCLCNYFSLFGQITPFEAVAQMQRGINIGNTMEPPTEGGWGNPAIQEYYFDDYKAAGFTSIRIPITWDKHTADTMPYKVDSVWLARVEQVVDWGLARDLFITINAHHEGWLKENYNDTTSARFDSIWSQISVKLKDKSDKLLFEILNEPRTQTTGLTKAQIDSTNKTVLKIIRKNNPTRLVIFSGNGWANSDDLVTAAIPDTADHYLIGYYHSYDPYPFGLVGTGTYGTAADVNATKAKFDQVKNWSVEHNIPVIISEFGATYKCEFNSRMFCYATVVEQALNHEVAFNAWEDGGDFKIYNRSSHTWNEIKDILVNFSANNPTTLKLVNNDGASVKITWKNRTTEHDSVFVQRGLSATTLTTIALLTPDSQEYTDETVDPKKTYYYRVVAHFNDSIDLYSYPQRVKTDLPNSVDVNQASLPIRFYPNPAQDFLTIETQSGDKIERLEVYNSDGRKMLETIPSTYNTKLQISDLSAGIYVVNVFSNSNKYKFKFHKL